MNGNSISTEFHKLKFHCFCFQVSAILTKAVTESLPYVNWITASLLGDINRYNNLTLTNSVCFFLSATIQRDILYFRREFCLKETKLYGASHRLVHDWLRKFPEEDSSRVSRLNDCLNLN